MDCPPFSLHAGKGNTALTCLTKWKSILQKVVCGLQMVQLGCPRDMIVLTVGTGLSDAWLANASVNLCFFSINGPKKPWPREGGNGGYHTLDPHIARAGDWEMASCSIWSRRQRKGIMLHVEHDLGGDDQLPAVPVSHFWSRNWRTWAHFTYKVTVFLAWTRNPPRERERERESLNESWWPKDVIM